MKCVPRVNCNLEGVMVNEVLNYTPAVEMLRVPLIVMSQFTIIWTTRTCHN